MKKSEECTMKKNVLIVGVSGAGKSTLVNAIAGQTVSLKFNSRMYKVHQASKIFNLKNCLGW